MALTGSYPLWQGRTLSADLELRGMLLATFDPETVTFLFAGFAVRWD
jgi:hypothetical protein